MASLQHGILIYFNFSNEGYSLRVCRMQLLLQGFGTSFPFCPCFVAHKVCEDALELSLGLVQDLIMSI